MTRSVEMYYGEFGGRWDTLLVNIPADTPDDKIQEAGIDAAYKILENKKLDVAFIGLYHIEEDYEEEDDED